MSAHQRMPWATRDARIGRRGAWIAGWAVAAATIGAVGACSARATSRHLTAPGRGHPAGEARVLRVGPGEKLETPGAAARAARDGDVIEIAAGIYPRAVAVWRANDLTIRGAGGPAHLAADGANAEGFKQAVNSVYVVNNTLVNDGPGSERRSHLSHERKPTSAAARGSAIGAGSVARADDTRRTAG